MLCRGRTLVKGKAFAGDRSVGHVLQAARVHAMRGVDELCILDIGATAEGRGPDLGMVQELSAGCFTPVTVGGGVKSLEDIDALLRAGADKVCIGTAALTNRTLIREASERFGRQAIVVSIDYRRLTPDKIPVVCISCGQDAIVSGIDGKPLGPVKCAEMVEDLGAGEILLQSIDRDGTLEGYDLEPVFDVAAAVSIPVIVSGGCSGPEDMRAAFRAGADACAAGALFQFKDDTPRSCASFLKANGVEVRQ